jgi:hypothetical protein
MDWTLKRIMCTCLSAIHQQIVELMLWVADSRVPLAACYLRVPIMIVGLVLCEVAEM